MEILKKLQSVQKELKAPKGQRNNFGNYSYRSCEDILEAVKPILAKQGLTLMLKDEVVNIGERYYVKATARLEIGEEVIETHAYAREAESKKGMDESQITGACSSYARKYALNGLFLIDDTKDADTMDNTKVEKKEKTITISDLVKQIREASGDDKKMAGVNKLIEEIKPRLNEKQKEVINRALLEG